MYPGRDFRSLLIDDANMAIKSISREPFIEVLYYWQQTGKPDNQLKIYQSGLEKAIANNRYSFTVFNTIEYFPEFYSSAILGIITLWKNLRYSLIITEDSPSLYIDSYKGDNVTLSMKDREQLLDILWINLCPVLILNNVKYVVGVFISRKAERIIQTYHWLCNLKEN